MTISFVTGNDDKFSFAESLCSQFGINLVQLSFDIDEIQGEDPETIIKDKAKRAYEITKEPVIVSDDSWHISALNGFPGAYMKSINHWFRPEDFINLMQGKSDRTAVCVQLLAHFDGKDFTIFRKDQTGKVAEEVKGNSSIPWRHVFISDGDDGLSLAELDEKGLTNTPERVQSRPSPWLDMVEWIKKNQKS